MAVRWYVMPAELVQIGGRTVRRPEHLNGISPAARFGWIPVNDNWGIGWADLTLAEHQTYNAANGVRFLTADLESTLGASAVAAVQAALDDRELPSSWVDQSDTWHETIKRVLCYLLCIQRFFGETRQSLNVGRPKGTLISSLSDNVRARIDAVASTLDLPAVQPGDTIETVMQRWADALIVREIFVGGILL